MVYPPSSESSVLVHAIVVDSCRKERYIVGICRAAFLIGHFPYYHGISLELARLGSLFSGLAVATNEVPFSLFSFDARGASGQVDNASKPTSLAS